MNTKGKVVTAEVEAPLVSKRQPIQLYREILLRNEFPFFCLLIFY